MALAETDGVLACGVSIDLLVDQITEHAEQGDRAHQVACPHCQAALAALSDAWGELRSFAREPVAIPVGLNGRIMAAVRKLVARWAGAVVVTGPRGDTRIDVRVVAQIARRAALSVPGVVLASTRGVAVDPSDRGRAGLSMRLAIAFGPAIQAVAAAVRFEIAERLSVDAGVGVDSVDIAVEDVVAGA